METRLKEIENSWSFALGSKLLIERLKVIDYPKDGIQFMLKHEADLFPNTFLEYKKLQEKQSNDQVTKAKKAVGSSFLAIRLLTDLSVNGKKPMIFGKELYKTIEEQIEDIYNVFPYVNKRLYQIYEVVYPSLFDLLHYKTLYLYFQLLVSRPKNDVIDDVVIDDAYHTFKEKVIERLDKVNTNDLWFLGNHEFEKLFNQWGVMGKLQHTILSMSMQEAKEFGSKLVTNLLETQYEQIFLLVQRLKNNPDFLNQFNRLQPEFKQMYKQLNECVVELFKLYEDFEITYLVDEGFIDSSEQVFLFLSMIKIQYDSLEVGALLEPESCITLEIEKTSDPTMSNEIKTIHEKAIIHRDDYIRKNLVTVYVLEL